MRGRKYPWEGRKSAELIGEPPVSVNIKTPALDRVSCLGIPQRLPRYSYFRRPPGIGAIGTHPPKPVPVCIVIEVVESQQITLHSIGVCRKYHCITSVVEIIKRNAYQVMFSFIKIPDEVGCPDRLFSQRVLANDAKI